MIIAFDRVVASASPLSGVMADGTLSTQASEQQFSLSPGISGLLGPSSQMTVSREDETLTLRRGSLLVDAAGSARIDVGDGTTVRLLAGSCFILRDERSVTMVALSAPVLALRGDEIWILPGGSQLSIAESGKAEQSAVPQKWLAEQSAKSVSLPVITLPPTDPLASLVAFLHSSDTITTDSLSAMLKLPAVSNDAWLNLLFSVQLAPEAERMNANVSEILSSVISTTVGPSQLAFAMPALARSTLKILPSSLIAGWAKAASRLAAEDPVRAASLLHDTVLALPSQYQHAGYPRQALLWRGAIGQVHTILSSLLTDAAADQYAERINATLREGDLSGGMLLSSQPRAAPRSEPQFTADQLTELTRQLLLSKEVLFSASVSITIDPNAVDCARVEGVYIAQSHRDVPYAFSYCPLEQFIRTIERDGKRLPNDVPIDRFFH